MPKYKSEKECINKSLKVQKAKRLFTIEARYMFKHWFWKDDCDWHVYSKYEKERDRDNALRQLTKNSVNKDYVEFRKGI